MCTFLPTVSVIQGITRLIEKQTNNNKKRIRKQILKKNKRKKERQIERKEESQKEKINK